MAEPTVPELVEQLARELLDRELHLVTAESCTGGGVACAITAIPGSSHWFERGFVTYANVAKQEDLGVDAAILEGYGAVSLETAAAMAAGALEHSHADISVAITGIAGPAGGSEAKPVGTVCFAWSRRGGHTRTDQVVFEGDRERVRQQAVRTALQGLIDLVKVTSDK